MITVVSGIYNRLIDHRKVLRAQLEPIYMFTAGLGLGHLKQLPSTHASCLLILRTSVYMSSFFLLIFLSFPPLAIMSSRI